MNNSCSMKGVGYGSATLLVLLIVLCLTFISAFAFRSAQTEYNYSERYSQSVVEYYKADSDATQILASLVKAGNIYEEVEKLNIQGAGVVFSEINRNTYTFSYNCPVNESLTLHIELEKSGKEWSILAWRLEDTQLWPEDTKVNVWQAQ